jgi:DNA-binding NarL/FixJ family response regulator
LSRAPRALVADEQPTMMASARRLLRRDGFTVCAEASDAEGAVEAALRERPDICLIGVPIPGGGILATERITTALPETAVVILTTSENRIDLVDAIRAGAAGYLLKGMAEERLASTIRAVLAGEVAIPRSLVAHLVREFHSQERRRRIAGENGHVDLTGREAEVMQLMCEGLSTREIADRLFLSPVTVRRHISETLGKLGVDDRDAAVALVGGQI